MSATVTHDPAGAELRSGAPQRLPRLLTSSRPQSEAHLLAPHRSAYPAPPLPGSGPRQGLIEAVERSGLRGRGGAGFPMGTKLRAVSRGPRMPVVVVNGSEGEPASRKDKLLLSTSPHLVLDGACVAAAATGAFEIIVCIDRDAHEAVATVQRALAQRSRAETSVATRIVTTPPRFVAGEESALVHLINGGEAKPTTTPPRVFEKGVGGRPTLVANVETLAHLAQIARFGVDWFRQLGTPEEPGSALVTLSGAVARPGVYEIPLGVALTHVLSVAGTPIDEVGAVLVGGYYGTWLTADEAAGARLSSTELRPMGASLGCGALVVIRQGVCGLRETARVLTWMAGETAGQCGPCVHGLAAIAGAATALSHGQGGTEGVARLERWAGQIQGRGACRFPDGAVKLLRSALRVFAPDVEFHAHRGVCRGCLAAPVLAIPAPKGPTWR